MTRVQAWEQLNDPHYCGQLTLQQLYDLMVRAGYSHDVSEKAAKQRGWERMCAGVAM
jgi:hypothetical protein